MILLASGLGGLRSFGILVGIALGLGIARPFIGPWIVKLQKRVKADNEARRTTRTKGNPTRGGKRKPTPVDRRHGRRR